MRYGDRAYPPYVCISLASTVKLASHPQLRNPLAISIRYPLSHALMGIRQERRA